MKIDGGFVSRVETQAVGRMLVKALLGIAATLEIEPVAKHVETEAQLDFLVENGCKRFQGHLFAAPKPADDFLALARGKSSPRENVVVRLPTRA
ncbi:MAG: EAL domain-containing protein [Phyllobacteriaceae bacterium]|nr:EAL domain-containing protein [Phyllobacteriaceae bacterium]